jgi:DNA-binding beta-propeller fold protein YncE
MIPRNSAILIPALILAVTLSAFNMTACSITEEDDSCQNTSTFVGDSGARHVLDVDLPFTPGPVAVISATSDGQSLSRSGRLWVGAGGTTLYALSGANVHSVDLATWDVTTFASVGYRAAQLAGSDRDSALLVTDHVRGSLWIMDSTCHTQSVEVEVGRGPKALALGPGRSIAYVANEWDKTLSLVETGVGTHVSTERKVIVAAQSEGQVVVLDGDGRLQRTFDNLPSQLLDLALMPGGDVVAVTYSEVVVTGDIEVTGDGEIGLSEGIALLDLISGEVTLHELQRPKDEGLHNLLARPTGMAVVDDSTHLVVALPGWGRVAVLDIDPASDTYGATLRTHVVPGNPRWVAAATLDEDWVYLLDDDTGSLVTLNKQGQITQEMTLR